MFGRHDLSKGQWEKLAIARAFARDAAVLILGAGRKPKRSRRNTNYFAVFTSFHAPEPRFVAETLLKVDHRILVIANLLRAR